MQKNYYFIGIGGVGMSALAHILLQKGHRVSGTDARESQVTKELEAKGAKIAYATRTSHVERRDIVVVSSAIKSAHPDLVEAKRLHLTVLHRSDLLKQLLEEKRSLMIAGAHGKTTITTMLTHLLKYSKYDPSYVIGGFSNSMQTNGGKGRGEFFVAEADESDGSFLKSTPYGAILTSVDIDHVHYYWKDEEELLAAYQKFISSVESKEHFVWCIDDEKLKSWDLQGYSYGFCASAKFRITNFSQTLEGIYFSIVSESFTMKDLYVPMYGRHNALNAAAVSILAHQLGVSENEIRKAFISFKGVKRRFEYRGRIAGLHVYDDYAHHPNEVSVTIDTFKELVKGKESTIIFQPHRYSRLKQCLEDFVHVLKDVDNLIVTDIYAAGEEMIDGICVELLLERLKNVTYISRKEIPKYLLKAMKKESVVLFLGAGDISKVAEEILQA